MSFSRYWINCDRVGEDWVNSVKEKIITDDFTFALTLIKDPALRFCKVCIFYDEYQKKRLHLLIEALPKCLGD